MEFDAQISGTPLRCHRVSNSAAPRPDRSLANRSLVSRQATTPGTTGEGSRETNRLSHERKLGRLPQPATANAGYYSLAQERAVQEKGVKWVAVPNRSTRSPERKQMEKSRWFKKAQRWRTGCEGRISVAKRRHGLRRCLYRGAEGMKRWVGLGVPADYLINIGKVLAAANA
jgi:hypothetical protein